MQRLEYSGAVRPLQRSLGVKGLMLTVTCNSTTHTDHILEFTLQQWLRERATVLRYT